MGPIGGNFLGTICGLVGAYKRPQQGHIGGNFLGTICKLVALGDSRSAVLF